MPREPESTDPEFWDARYAAGKMRWDFGGVPPALSSYLQRATGTGRVLIPGCGSGYEIQAFANAGFKVTAIDFSSEALKRASEAIGLLANRIILDDFFRHNFGPASFDLIYERTFLCSLPRSHWPDYAKRMAGLLKKGGKLAGLFFYGRESDPPPFPLTEAAANELFAKDFRLERTENVGESLDIFRGTERWQEWVKK